MVSGAQEPELDLIAFIIVASVDWLIVRQPVEIYRTIEIRPDCMIRDGREVFWARHIETVPRFSPGKDGTRALTGIYGTRKVEYLRIRKFDEFDSTPDVFAAHLGIAFPINERTAGEFYCFMPLSGNSSSFTYTPTEILQWITCPHAQLNCETPERLLARGKYKEVREMPMCEAVR